MESFHRKQDHPLTITISFIPLVVFHNLGYINLYSKLMYFVMVWKVVYEHEMVIVKGWSCFFCEMAHNYCNAYKSKCLINFNKELY